jgi:NhaP-type Na+/H+ or K+/H+ antiporter
VSIIGSLLIGLSIALFAALLIKFQKTTKGITKVEILLMILSPWLSYLIAESMQLSGIMSVLCNGIFLAHYAAPNLNSQSRTIMKNIYGTTSHISETTVFLFLGISFSAFDHPYAKMGAFLFIGAFIIITFISRFMTVGTVFKLSNMH